MTEFKRMLFRAFRHPTKVMRMIRSTPEFARLYFQIFRDPRVPLFPKMVVVAALIYFVVPSDLFPEFVFPIVGWVDDLLLLGASFKYLLRKCPPEVLAEHGYPLRVSR